MRKLLTALVTAALLISILPSNTLAVSGWMQIFENSGYGGDFLTKDTGNNVSNLANVSTGLHGGCNRGIYTLNNWNDCASSFKVNLAPLKCIALYDAANYTIPKLTFKNTSETQAAFFQISNLADAGWNDRISSIKWGTYFQGVGCGF